jgi:hypothetical protein
MSVAPVPKSMKKAISSLLVHTETLLTNSGRAAAATLWPVSNSCRRQQQFGHDSQDAEASQVG